MKNISLTRPLAIIDLETTGLNPQKDRIVEISILKVLPDGQTEQRTHRVNPRMSIPPDATAIHHITNADVADEPTFPELADELLAFLEDCDLCGFNLKRFDLRFLSAEFDRAGTKLSLEGRAIIDPMEIFHRQEPRDLAGAVRFYLGRNHQGAHSAEADARATAEVLDAMIVRYALPDTVDALHNQSQDERGVDSNGCFNRVGRQICFAFGKYRGQPLESVAASKPAYLEWMLTQSFPEDTKEVVRNALERAG